MASASCHPSVLVFVTTIFLAAAIVMIPTSCTAQLTSDFYKQSCPQALQIIRSVVEQAINNEKRMGASLLRLHFHDCFVNVGFKLLYLIDLFFLFLVIDFSLIHVVAHSLIV